MLEDRYVKCCNYCKWFKPDDDLVPVPFNDGSCECKWVKMQDGVYSAFGVVNFYSCYCVFGFKHTIHNHYGLPYPEYAEEYKRAISFREKLYWDVYNYKSYNYAMLDWKDNFKNEK